MPTKEYFPFKKIIGIVGAQGGLTACERESRELGKTRSVFFVWLCFVLPYLGEHRTGFWGVKVGENNSIFY